MFDRAAWNRAYNKERRAWYQARGICCECGAEWAKVGRTLCPKCTMIQHEKDVKKKDRKAQQEKQRKAMREAKGLCNKCGKRKARPGRKTCKKCAERQRERDINRSVKKRMERGAIV